MRARTSAFSLLESLTTATIGTLLLSLALPTAARVRELSKRSTCAINLAGIGASSKIYANNNAESWMIPPFSGKAYDPGRNGIDYLNDDGTIGRDRENTDPGEVGWDRRYSSTSDNLGVADGSTAVSVTRAFWMMVRSGDISVQQFICPSSSDAVDPTERIDLYYDFTGYAYISYGYQVPYGPHDTQPREGADHRMVFAADKSPYYRYSDPSRGFQTGGPGGRPITPDDPPRYWRPFNSPNHGGRGNGEGQNVLFANGGVSFVRIPAMGIDDDNIYTLMVDGPWDDMGSNRVHGDSVHVSHVDNPYPGAEALRAGDWNAYASTDSLIYP